MDEPRIAEAVTEIEAQGIATAIPLAEPTSEMVEMLVAQRGVKDAIAKRMLSKPLIRAAAMVACGEQMPWLQGPIVQPNG